MLPISEAMRAALTAPTVEFDFGVDLLDAEDRVVGDLSADVTAMSVEHTLRADVHRTCTLSLTRDLVWGVDRVRPWVSVWDGHSEDVTEYVERGEVLWENYFINPRLRDVNGDGTPEAWFPYSTAGGTGSSGYNEDGTWYFTRDPVLDPATPPLNARYGMRAYATFPEGFKYEITVPVEIEGDLSSVSSVMLYVDLFGSQGNLYGQRMVLDESGTLHVTVPVGYYSATVYVWVSGPSPTPVRVKILRAQMSISGAPYFDGDTPGTATVEYAWTGAPHASTSVARRVERWVERTPQVHRWPLGVFLLTTPEQVAGESPRTRTVTGMDKLWLLQREVGDTYVVPAGTSYLDAIRGVLTDAGVTGGLLLQGDRQTTALAEPAVWPLLEDGYTWLDVANGLLGMIAYQGLWTDEMGRFRSAPVVDPHQVGTAWTFDTTDVLEGVVGEDRTLSADVYDLPNHWRFVRNKDRALTADDTYVVDRTDGLLPQQVRRRTVYLDVADRDALVAEGDRIVAEDTATERITTLSISPLPFEHGDVVQLRDPDLGLYARGVVRRWSIDQDGTTSIDVEVL